MSDCLITQLDENGTATVILNRPDVHNAFDPELVERLNEVLDDIATAKDVRAVLLAGAGENFCAGADIAHMKASAAYTRRRNVDLAHRMALLFQKLDALPKPTIALVRGAVRGGGCGLVAACDIAIASRFATFRLTEVKLGIIPAVISPYVVRAMGERYARRYMLTGEELDAGAAYRVGLVHDIVEEDDLIPRASELLEQLHSSGPHAMAAVKQLVPLVARTPIGDRLTQATAELIADIRATPEAQEGLAAFLDKRKPAWVEGRPLPTPAKKTARQKAVKKTPKKAVKK